MTHQPKTTKTEMYIQYNTTKIHKVSHANVMDSLNTDCLIEIIKYLKLKDQITLHQVNTSLQEAVTALWLIRYKNVQINFIETPLSNREWYRFLKGIKTTVEVMQLRFLTKEKYEVMKCFKSFDKVRNFRFTLSKPYFMEDNDLKDLTRLLPNLRAFSPHGNLTGLYMDEWPHLQELNLSFCFKLEMQHFQIILKHLKLEKLNLNIFPNNKQFEQMNLNDAQVEFLQYLELNTYEFYYFLAKPLANLKDLIITNHYNPRQLFDVLLSVWSAKQILKIETSNVDDILVNCLDIHMNVEQLTIVNDENPLPANIIPSMHLLSDLRLLRFKNCNFNSILAIQHLLATITQITEISFENCQFNTANIRLIVDDIVVNRTTKLRLNMFANRLIDNRDMPIWLSQQEINNVLVTSIGSHQLFEVTYLPGPSLCYQPLFVQFR